MVSSTAIPRRIARIGPDICEIGVITINPNKALVIMLEIVILLCLIKDSSDQEDTENTGVSKLTINTLRVIPSINTVSSNMDLMELNQKKDTIIVTIIIKILFFI